MEQTPSDYAFQYVIDRIKSSQWIADEKILSENELSSKLNVSRVAVRQAYDKLDALGLIVKKRGSGTYISNLGEERQTVSACPVLSMDNDDVIGLLKFRKFFEHGNVQIFTEICTDEDVDKLRVLVDIMDNAKDAYEYAKADFLFHSMIAEGTNNPVVIRVNDILLSILEEQQLVLNKKIGSKIGKEFHRQILDAIAIRDSELASLLMLRHIDSAIKKLEEL